MKSIAYAAVVLMMAAAAGAQAPASAQSIEPRVTPPSEDVPPPPIPVPLYYKGMRARYVKAHWTFPTTKEMNAAYPPKAQDAEMEGTVRILCGIKPDGHMDYCVVQDESPSGYGFGRTTVALFLKTVYVDPSTVEGGIQANDFNVFIYKWQIGAP